MCACILVPEKQQVQRQKLRLPRRGREAEECHRRKGQGAKHGGAVRYKHHGGMLPVFLSQKERKEVRKSTEIIRCSRVAFWQAAGAGGMNEFSLGDLNLLRKMGDKVMW